MLSHPALSTVRTVAAPASVVYGMLADASRWPVLLSSSVHAERMDFDGSREQVWLWDVVADRVRSSRARRVLHPQTRTIEFEESEDGSASLPGAEVAGSWTVQAEGEHRATVTSSCRVVSAGPAGSLVTLERDIGERLDGLCRAAEQWEKFDELMLSFEESVRVDGPAELVYDFLYRMADWPDLVPHIDWTRVTEDRPGVQVAAFGTCAEATGRTVALETVRLCFPHAGRIVFKETVTPELIAAHSGEWSVVPDEAGLTVSCLHRLLLREADIEPVLGAGACPADARLHVRERLAAADRETLGLARWHAQSAVRRVR
jgi:aromatase